MDQSTTRDPRLPAGPEPRPQTPSYAEPHPGPHSGPRPRRRSWAGRKLWLRGGLALCGWPALAATALPDGHPLRWITVLLFVLLGPGCALLLPLPGSLRPAARLEVLALAGPVSLSLATLTATALFLVAGFTTPLFLGSLAVFCTVVGPLPAVPLPAATRGAAERAKPDPEVHI